MESNSATLQNALATLREHHGEQLAGPMRGTEAQLRSTLQQALNLSEVQADNILGTLRDNGQLAYIGSKDTGNEPGTTVTGPVISMPTTQSADGGSPLITTASPAMIMGIVNDEGGDVGQSVEGDQSDETTRGMTEPGIAFTGDQTSPAPVTVGEREEAEDDHTAGYWRIG